MPQDDLRLSAPPTVKVGMLVRKPPPEVFEAFVDPSITTRFWFTHSTGKLVPGAQVRWDWEMYGISTEVSVKVVEENNRIVYAWGRGTEPTTVEIRFIPWKDDTTYVTVTETGLTGSGDEEVAYAMDSAGGYSFVLAAAKALLEHGIELAVVGDHVPKGLKI
jgi:uncharacterized protein YndB with AHSA1/START domain